MVAVATAANPGVTLTYFPRGAARDVLTSRDAECLIEGPAGTGKTMALCHKMHLAARKYPRCRILLVRKTLESLKTGALSTYLKHVRPELDGVIAFGGNKFYPAEFRYPNGSVIVVSGMDKADKIMSSEFDVAVVNEATELTLDDWQALKTRLRNGVMPYQQIIADCNPSGARHWLNQRCNDGATRRLRSRHTDNPAYWDVRRGEWTVQGRVYVERNLAGLTGVRRARLLDGVWAAAEGQVYPDFNPDQHVRAVDVLGWRPVIGVDVGSRNPTAILTAHVRGDGYVHVSHEVYRRNMTSSDIVAAIAAEADSVLPEAIFIDPSAKGYIDDLARDGYPVVAATNDVLIGIQRVQTALVEGFSIDPSCTNTIDEFGMYRYPENTRAETDKPVKEDDHGMDALRYLCLGALTPVVDIAEAYAAWA